MVLFEHSNGPIHYDPGGLVKLKLNPLLSEAYKRTSLCSDCHSDSNCEYYTKAYCHDLLRQKICFMLKIVSHSWIIYRFTQALKRSSK